MTLFSQRAMQIIEAAEVMTLSTLGKDGTILSNLVWYVFDGNTFQINTEFGSPKEINIRKRDVATVLITDPNDCGYYITARCVLDHVQTEGTLEQLDRLTKRHMNIDHWYGGVVPDNIEEKARSVIVHLTPVRLYEAFD